MEVGIVLLFIILIVVIRLVAGQLDTERIEQSIQSKGGQIIFKEWSPFGRGWLGSQHDRIYLVKYLDKDKNKHEAYIKTSGSSA